MSYCVYRLYDQEGQLLYVGHSRNLKARLANHRMEQPWWFEVASCETTQYPDKPSAVAAEQHAIRHELPRHNVMYHPNPAPRSTTWLRIHLPDDLHRQLKVQAIMKRIPLRTHVVDLLTKGDR